MKKIVLTGGGTGGHIFPLLAVAEELQKMNGEVELFYIGPNHPLNTEFAKRNIKILPIAGSKLRRYFDWQNFLDILKFLWSILQSIAHIFYLQPDLVFSKGGPGALPVVLAAKCFFIPVVIHDSDAVPGLTNRLSAIFAEKIFLGWKSAEKYFPKNKTEVVGNPIRRELLENSPKRKTAKKPLVLIIAGSQGATRINSFVFANIKELLKFGNVLHQVGEKNLGGGMTRHTTLAFGKGYRAVGFLGIEELRTALADADLVISRAGASAIYEVAAFGKPSILIPLKDSASDHQKTNAYEYAATGAAVVVEEDNLNWPTVKEEIEKILKDKEQAKITSEAAKSFAKPSAAITIAEKLLQILQKE